MRGAWDHAYRVCRLAHAASRQLSCSADYFGPPPVNPSRRVVVTGLGLVTPLAVGVQDSWEALLGGRTGVRALTEEDLPEVTFLHKLILLNGKCFAAIECGLRVRCAESSAMPLPTAFPGGSLCATAAAVKCGLGSSRCRPSTHSQIHAVCIDSSCRGK